MFALTDETGAVVERYDYGDFGEPEFYDAAGNAISGTAYGNPYLFTGRRFDPESGFYYYRARYYDPRVGQFTTRDPIGVWGDPLNMGNGYAYCGNNPWSLVDPWGLEGGFFEGFADLLGLGGLRDMRSRKERMVDGISMGHYVPKKNNALLLAGMADFEGKVCLQVKVKQVEEFSRSVANSVGYLLTAGSAFEWGQSYLEQADEFKYSDPWVYYGTYAAHYTSIAASLSAAGLMACEYIAATPGGLRGTVPGRRNAALSRVHWNNGWRTPDGKFASPQGPGMPGATAQSRVWDAIERKPGWRVVRGRVYVRNAAGDVRVYDGVAISPREYKIGLEVKSGTARYGGSQAAFDSGVHVNSPATVVGQHAADLREVMRVLMIRVP